MKKLAGLFLIIGFLAMACSNENSGNKTSSETTQAKYYSCPMHPKIHSEKEGKCPECGMDLIETDAKSKTETFGVNGNCGMCKETIEGALKKNNAISAASWDDSTKELTITYESDKITIDQIHQLVADVGYDTDKIKAKDEVYNNLHGCCKYDRK